jgi:acyl-CoA synthetase (AMP-forming)/AMP-acid ligase II
MEEQRFHDRVRPSMGDRDIPTFGALLRERASECGDNLFLAFENGEERTYSQLYRRSRSIAKALVAFGIEPGDHVGLLMPNAPETLEILFGILLAGAVAAPINNRFKSELADVLPRSAVRLLFTTRSGFVDFLPLVWDAVGGSDRPQAGPRLRLDKAPDLEAMVICGGEATEPAVDFDAFLRAGERVDDEALNRRIDQSSASDIAFLLYTSGTTAEPKGCLLTHAALIGCWQAHSRLFGLAGTSAYWTPAPNFHLSVIGPLTSALWGGARFLSMVHFEPEAAWRMIEEYRAEHLAPGFPAVTMPLFASPRFDRAKARYVRTVGNVAPKEVQRQLEAMLPEGTVVIASYGMTEAAGPCSMTRPDGSPDHRLASCGSPMPGVEIRIADRATEEECATGEVGEIRFRSPHIFHSYFRDPDATAATRDGEGWVRSGDAGFIDANGDVHYVGRIKDMLKVGGENVVPAEVEGFLATHPSVRMAQVIGKPDRKYGEVPVAFVELNPGASLQPDELIDWCRGRLASYKLPREVRIVREWPMSATKVQKHMLARLL